MSEYSIDLGLGSNIEAFRSQVLGESLEARRTRLAHELFLITQMKTALPHYPLLHEGLAERKEAELLMTERLLDESA